MILKYIIAVAFTATALLFILEPLEVVDEQLLPLRHYVQDLAG